MKIPISFKKTEKDLYDFLNSKRSPSCYIKDLLEKEMNQNNNSNMNTEVVNNNNLEYDSEFDF